MEEKEREIDFKDLLYRISLRWRTIIVLMLVFALLAVAFTAFKSYSAYKEYEQSYKEKRNEYSEYELRIEEAECKNNLTETEARRVLDEVDDYWYIRESYLKARDRAESSFIMQLDPYAVSKKLIGYFVDAHAEAEYPVISKTDFTSDILNSLIASITPEFYEKVIQTTGIDADCDELKEVISANTSAHSVIFTIYGSDEEFCNAVSEIIQDNISEVIPKLTALYGEFDITQNLDTYSVSYEENLLNSQNSIIERVNNKKKSMNNYETTYLNNFSSDQQAYFDVLVELKMAQSGENETQTYVSDPDDMLELRLNFINIKYIIIGVLAGAVLGCGVICVKYLFSSGLKTADDIKTMTGTTILGTLDLTDLNNKPFSFLDRMFHRLFNRRDCVFSNEERTGMICSGVRIAVEKNKLRRVFITGVGNDKDSLAIINMLAGKLSGIVEIVETGRSIVFDPEALEKFASSDGVVLVERVEASVIEDIKREFETAAQNDVYVIGSVVLS